MLLDIEHLREDYRERSLDIGEVDPDPFLQFKRWFQEAQAVQLKEPNAMTLATSTPEGYPSARIVLLKGFDEEGFIFYSNYGSRKGMELAANPRAALVFLWLELQRQVRVEGTVERLTIQQSTTYFQSRPKDSQIGAWASPQSRVIGGREELELKVRQLNEQYDDVERLPLPEDWGGYRVRPHLIEFWQGRTSRLHDRLQYNLQKDGKWSIDRLAP